MKQNNFWKWFMVLFVTGWAVYELYPPFGRGLIAEFNATAVNRDTNLVQIVETARELEQTTPNRTYANLRDAIGTNDITQYFPMFPLPQGETEPTRAILQRLQRQASGELKLGLDLQGGTAFVVRLQQPEAAPGDTNAVDQTERQALVEQAIEVLRKRVDRFGVAEPVIQPAGEDRILIQLPGLSESEIESARTTLEKAAFLEFRLVHPESAQLIEQGLSAPGYEKLYIRRTTDAGQEILEPYLVKRRPEQGLTGAYVTRSGVTRDPLSNQPQITLRFDSEGAEIFGEITRQNTGRQLAIVLDGELYSAPAINEPILGGNAVISGDFSLSEAFELANVLENPLEAPVTIVAQTGVDPSLGKDSIESGINASIYGVVFVALFMLVYYRKAGLVANVALILNIVILLGVMAAVDATLTVPGIAGIVLTIGMAVDANVLIYERIREELSAGKSLRGAIVAGYSKAFTTIFDSNITTLIASIILIFMGTGPVQGFGVTLSIGVAISMFTALVVTRLIFDSTIERGIVKSLPMFSLVKGTSINFLKWSKPAFIASWLLIIAGIGYGIYRGSDVMGVEFAGGDKLTLAYSERVGVDQIRSSLSQAGVTDVTIQYQASMVGDEQSLSITAPFGTDEKVRQALQSSFPDAGFSMRSIEKVGPAISGEILRSAIAASLLAMFGILVYVAMRYEFSFAVGAVIAVIHDVLMSLGIYFLAGRELNAPILAAVLTIIGFSINDTIVIFDRIREDLKLGMKGNFAEIMNRALNQTLSRTLITSGTLFLATLSLYLFGGGVINDFAFIFLVGILTGVYSTMYIACALVLWWHKGEKPKTAATVVIDNGVTARA